MKNELDAIITCDEFGYIEYSGPLGKFGYKLLELASWVDLGNKDPIEWKEYTIESMSEKFSKDCGAFVSPKIIGEILNKNPEFTYRARRQIACLNELSDSNVKSMEEIEEIQYKHGVHINQTLGGMIGIGEPVLLAKPYNCGERFVYTQSFAGDEGLIGPLRKKEIL